jgi:hypothetical protein
MAKPTSKISGQMPDGTNSNKSNGNRMNPGGQNAGKPNQQDKTQPKSKPNNLEMDDSGLIMPKGGPDPDLLPQPGTVNGNSGAGGRRKTNDNKR